MAYPANQGVHAYTHSSESPYAKGFNMALAHSQNNCHYRGFFSSSQNACVAGYIAGLNKTASLTSPYHVGYKQGVKDHLDNIVQDFCKIFHLQNRFDFSPEWDCQQGYQSGYAAPVSKTQSESASTAIEQTQAYKVGYSAGTSNSSLGYQACAKFNGRDGQICTNAFDIGYRTLPWNERAIYQLGYQYGFKASKPGAEGGDEAGDCSFVVLDAKKSAVCERGWDAGYKTGGGK